MHLFEFSSLWNGLVHYILVLFLCHGTPTYMFFSTPSDHKNMVFKKGFDQTLIKIYTQSILKVLVNSHKLKDFTDILEVKDMHQRPFVKHDEYFLTRGRHVCIKVRTVDTILGNGHLHRMEIIYPSSHFSYKTAQKMICSSVIKMCEPLIVRSFLI